MIFRINQIPVNIFISFIYDWESQNLSLVLISFDHSDVINMTHWPVRKFTHQWPFCSSVHVGLRKLTNKCTCNYHDINKDSYRPTNQLEFLEMKDNCANSGMLITNQLWMTNLNTWEKINDILWIWIMLIKSRKSFVSEFSKDLCNLSEHMF